jgi:REP-associated tyrosine transposase
MPYRQTAFRAGSCYHLYNRGVNRQPIFFRDENWGYMIRRIRHYFRPELVDIVAYCLMPTHYHLLVYLKTDDLSKQVMQPFGLSYTKAVNKQQGRVGPLFQGPFQAVRVDRDAYLLHLSRYIHMNPVAAGLVERPADWVFSSYRDYIDLRRGTLPVTHAILSQFSSPQAYQEFVESYSDQNAKIIKDVLFDESG